MTVKYMILTIECPGIVPPGGITLGGYYLPPGTTATTQSFSLHRDPTLWPNPLEFKPERWLPTSASQNSKYSINDAARVVYSPFGSGSRTCLGIHLAKTEMRLAVAQFFRDNVTMEARLAASATPQSMEQENYFLIAPVGHRLEIDRKR